MPFFEARGLQKRFGSQVVLQDVSCAWTTESCAGSWGPTEPARPPASNVLTGRYAPDGGEVLFEGRPIGGRSPREIARLGISRSFQVMNLFDEYSAIDNVVIALPQVRERGWSMWRDLARQQSAYDEAAALLAQVGLAGKEKAPSRRLSYGERRALEIGVALAARPRLLFLDEPTAGLGVEGTGRLFDLILSLKRRLAIVIIEHDMHFLFRLADPDLSVIHWGQVIAEGTPESLRANPWVQR